MNRVPPARSQQQNQEVDSSTSTVGDRFNPATTQHSPKAASADVADMSAPSTLQLQPDSALKQKISDIKQEIAELKQKINFLDKWIKTNKSNKSAVVAKEGEIKLAEQKIKAKEERIVELETEERLQLMQHLKKSTALQPNKASNESKNIQSLVVGGKLVSFKVDQAKGRDVRGTFLNLHEQGKYTPGPMATAESTLLPGNTAEVIVLGKKPTFEPCGHYAPQRGEQITDIIAVGAQLTTTVMRAKQVADPKWREASPRGFSSCVYLDGQDATSVGTMKYREVLFSTQGNMNFHTGNPAYIPAMVQLAGCRAEPSKAEFLPNDFKVPSADELNTQHTTFDDQLRNHLLTSLTGETLP